MFYLIRASVVLTALCVMAAIVPAKASADAIDIGEVVATRANSNFSLYDFTLPALISALLLDPGDSVTLKRDKAVAYVNFYSTTGKYQRYSGLGTELPWFVNSSVMLKSGNIYCSEQSYLASMILDAYYPQKALRDAGRHTFHEFKHNGRWVIVDPMLDVRIDNSRGLPISFIDVQTYLNGDREVLDLPEEPLPRTSKYLRQLSKEEFLRLRHDFGQNIPMQPMPYSAFIGVPLQNFIDAVEKQGASLEANYLVPYLMYVRNNLYKRLMELAPKERLEKAWEYQDHFLKHVAGEAERGLAPPEAGDELYVARQYQLLGRYDEALVMYGKMEPSEQISFYKSQIHFMTRDLESFDSLAEDLSGNEYYRHMYFLLHDEYLREDDKEFFAEFQFKWVTKKPPMRGFPHLPGR